MKSMLVLTKSDLEFLSKCPKGKWFSEDEMFLWRRYRYRLSRLAERNMAEWRCFEIGTREYRIKE